MEHYGMFGKFIAQPGQRDALLKILLRAAENADKMAGCEQHIVHTSPSEPDAIWVSEIWRSQQDHDASLTLPASQELIAQARPLIMGFGERFVTTPIGGLGLAGD